MKRFELKLEHIKLLNKMWVVWWDTEFGAPGVDPKRPYGNSDVYGDMAEILDLEFDKEDPDEKQIKYLSDLHDETQTALEVVLTSASFEQGLYEQREYTNEWYKVYD